MVDWIGIRVDDRSSLPYPLGLHSRLANSKEPAIAVLLGIGVDFLDFVQEPVGLQVSNPCRRYRADIFLLSSYRDRPGATSKIDRSWVSLLPLPLHLLQ